MGEMTRQEMLDFLVQAVKDIEGAIIGEDYFESYTNEQLAKEVVWMDYLYDK